MNCSEANNFSLVDLLTKLNHKPTKETENVAWYLSPFRNEKTASFRVVKSKNRWRDYGDGSGKTAIDLIIKLNNCTVLEALAYFNNNSFSFHEQKNFIPKDKSNCEIISVGRIESFKLIKYLHSRKIDISLARKYCKEIHFYNKMTKSHYGNDTLKQNDIVRKPLYTIGIKNDLDGYDTRNKSYKRCLNKKAISTIKNGSNTLNLFEGFIDFLSYLTLMPTKENEDFIITNSTSLVKNTIELLPEYYIVKTFFDNDLSGKKAAKLIQENCSSNYLDESEKYKKHTDVNDYLIAYKG
ncbi:toprim domain-containing protein [Mesonia ostreae]|uniref:Toprim domain-containing protein n=1 Tax=Mesonia ostreae TaxID=861110 RepID=A0ABU2KKE6_9FLAO|nr:toprim domain-containing protein [Mesonia ostreae]MDT0295180.1 toprim domain-containing protein [Mesonia ostreae]